MNDNNANILDQVIVGKYEELIFKLQVSSLKIILISLLFSIAVPQPVAGLQIYFYLNSFDL